MDKDNEKRLDTLYRNTKQMPILTILGIFVPIVLFVAAPLGILYSIWRRNFLRDIDSEKFALTDPETPTQGVLSNSEKLEFIRVRKVSLLAPTMVVGAYILLIIGVIVFTASNQPAS